jgi:hypothetical protein
MCGNTVTFPAIPTKKGAAPVQTKPSSVPKQRGWKWPAALAFLGGFQRWDLVAQCVVPFLVIGALLAGAYFVKNKLTDTSPPPEAPTVAADPQAWQKMTDLEKAEDAVRQRMQELDAARAALKVAQNVRQSTERMSASQQISAAQAVHRAELAANAAERSFNDAMTRYQKLGGTVDFRSQLRR